MRAHGEAVFLEDGDGSSHFADFILAAGKGHFGVEVAVGDFLDRVA